MNLREVLAAAFLVGFLSSLLVSLFHIGDITILYALVAFTVLGLLQNLALGNSRFALLGLTAVLHGGIAAVLASAVYFLLRSRSQKVLYICLGASAVAFLLCMFILGDPGELP
jgi:hypothetical protein